MSRKKLIDHLFNVAGVVVVILLYGIAGSIDAGEFDPAPIVATAEAAK